MGTKPETEDYSGSAKSGLATQRLQCSTLLSERR